MYFMWRWFGTAFSYLMFGIGGVVLSVVVVPCLRVASINRADQERRTLNFIHNTFRYYIRMMRGLGVLDYELLGSDRLVGARLLLANHPSLLDVVFLMAFVPQATCVVKGRLVRNPFIRGAIKTAGYIINDETNDVIDEAMKAFDQGRTLIVFPEGTRTTPGQKLCLKRGAAQIALRTQVSITPVYITCKPTTLTKLDAWYYVPRHKVKFCFRVGAPLSVDKYIEQYSPSIGARRLTQNLTEYFNKESNIYE